ncbi:MAG: PAS domain-containing protein [Steroidobacteraceae bacterium]
MASSELNHLIHALPDLIWIALLDGSAESLNLHWFEYTGLTLDQAMGIGWQSAIHPDDLPLLLANWLALSHTGQRGNVEARLRRYDGEYRRFLFRTEPVTDESGQVVKWWIHARGLSLREEEGRSFAGRPPPAEKHERLAQALLAGEKLLLEKVARGHPLISVLEDLSRLMEDLLKASLCDILLVAPNGERFWVSTGHTLPPNYNCDAHSCWSVPIMSGNGKALGVFAIYRDERASPRAFEEELVGRLTTLASIAIERAQADAALKASEAELRRAYDALAEAQRLSRTGSFITDLVAEEHNWSEELYRIFEFNPATKVTVPFIRDVVHPEDLSSFDAGIARSMDGADFDLVFRIFTPSRDLRHLHAVAHVTQKIEGRPLFIGAIQDVTESRVAEEALNRARTELAHVARVTTLGALTASIAHEVNQPLAGIITNASTCLRMLGTDPPNLEGARATAQRTIRDANRASEVVKRLRALFSRKQSSMDPIDLNDAAREVLALSASDLQRNGVILRTQFAEGLPPVRGDRVQLQQVILNLALNAAEAMKEIESRPRNLLVTTALDKLSQVVLSVRDSGVGFEPQQNPERCFDAFHTTKRDGMGIGLSISRSIIESHAGRLLARANDDGPGATFAFSIPCGPEPAAGHVDPRNRQAG